MKNVAVCRLVGTIIASIVLLGLVTAQAQGGVPKFIHVKASVRTVVAPAKPFVVEVAVTIDKPYHIQANPPKKDYIPTVVEFGPVSGFKVVKIVYPKAVVAKVAGIQLPVYEGTVVILATLTADKSVRSGMYVLPVTIRFQGCSDVSCYPPKSLTIEASGSIGPTKSEPGKKSTLDSGLILAQAKSAGDTGYGGAKSGSVVQGFKVFKVTQFKEPKPFIEWLKEGGAQGGQAERLAGLLTTGGTGKFALALGIIFLLGIALNLTPCVYTIIPITIGYFGRQAASGAKTGLLSVAYASGIALMYTLLGLIAALLGKGFGSQLNSPIVLVGFAAVMFALGLSNFDRADGRPIRELQLPASVTGQARSRAGYLGVLCMGLLVGLVAAPCIGPVVVALIGIVGASKSVGLGAVTSFALGMGLAVPYLALGFGLIKSLPRAGEWLVAMKRIFGLLLFGMGIYYLQLLLGSTVYRYVFSLYCVMAGAYLILLDNTAQNHSKFLAFKRGVGARAIALGIYAFVPSTGASPKMAIAFADVSDFNAFQSRVDRARADGKNVLVDFRATWCAACKELDEQTFHNAGVVKATSEYIALRVDLTDFDGDRAKPFRALFDIAGLPTIVHLTPDSSGASTNTARAFARLALVRRMFAAVRVRRGKEHDEQRE